MDAPTVIQTIIPQQRIRSWGLQSVKQRRGDRGFGSRVPDSVMDVCVFDCRNRIWRLQVKNHLSSEAARDRSSFFDGGEIQVCSRRENAAIVLPEHAPLCTERDPSVLVACERSSLSHEHVFFLAHGERSKCARGVRTQQSFRWNMSLCARREIQVGSQRANAAVLSHEHACLFAHGKRSKCARGVGAQQSFSREHVSLRTERDPSVLVACERSSLVA